MSASHFLLCLCVGLSSYILTTILLCFLLTRRRR